MSIWNNLVGGGLNYYLSGLGAEQAREQAALANTQLTELGQTSQTGTQFQPYTVTSGLANVGTTAQGGFNLNLSPQQQAMQDARFGQANQFFGQAGQGMTPQQQQAASSLFGQAQGQFGQVGQGMTRAERDAQRSRFREAESMFGRARGDTGELASEYYENIRAAQRPEEARQRMALDQGLFSSGRGGISTAEFGGTAEEFAFDKARAEAGLQASARARQAALGEQAQALSAGQSLFGQAYAGQQAAQARDQQALALGSGLMGQSYVPSQQALAQQAGYANLGGAMQSAGYMPQQQALDLFGASQIPAQLASRGQIRGQELSSILGQAGIEALMQGEDIAGNLDMARLQAIIPLLTGSGGAGGIGGGGGSDSTDSIVDALIGLFTGNDEDETSGNVATLPDDFDGSL